MEKGGEISERCLPVCSCVPFYLSFFPLPPLSPGEETRSTKFELQVFQRGRKKEGRKGEEGEKMIERVGSTPITRTKETVFISGRLTRLKRSRRKKKKRKKEKRKRSSSNI